VAWQERKDDQRSFSPTAVVEVGRVKSGEWYEEMSAGESAESVVSEAAERDVVADLRAQLWEVADARQGRGARHVWSSGIAALDACLPAGGLRGGSLVEWWEPVSGSGAAQLSWWTAAALARQRRGRIAVVECASHCRQEGSVFYPPAAIGWGVPAERLMVVRAAQTADALWACDQLLRCESLAAVWWCSDPFERCDDRAARRLQLAAEIGGGLGLIVRSAAQRRQPSWAEVQWVVQSHADERLDRWWEAERWWELELRRCWGGRGGERIGLRWDARRGVFCRAEDRIAPRAVVASSGSEQRPVRSRVEGTAPEVRSGLQQGVEHGSRTTAAALHLAAQLAHATLAQRVARQQARQQRRA
jgi:hypothetical protein